MFPVTRTHSTLSSYYSEGWLSPSMHPAMDSYILANIKDSLTQPKQTPHTCDCYDTMIYWWPTAATFDPNTCFFRSARFLPRDAMLLLDVSRCPCVRPSVALAYCSLTLQISSNFLFGQVVPTFYRMRLNYLQKDRLAPLHQICRCMDRDIVIFSRSPCTDNEN